VPRVRRGYQDSVLSTPLSRSPNAAEDMRRPWHRYSIVTSVHTHHRDQSRPCHVACLDVHRQLGLEAWVSACGCAGDIARWAVLEVVARLGRQHLPLRLVEQNVSMLDVTGGISVLETTTLLLRDYMLTW